MKITFLGAAHEVTGSCTLLNACGRAILIDCGMEQGADIYENCTLPLAPGEIDCVLLTHAHIDHSGKLPVLTSNGYAGPIYTTEATAKLCSIMLTDAAHIQESEAEWRNRKAARAGGQPYTPLYTVADAQKTCAQFRPCGYGQEIRLLEGVTARFLDAGHLLGSASIELTITENGRTKTLLFSGDIGNVSRPLIRDPQKPEKADFVVIESTYGDRLHGPRPDYIGQLTRIIQQTLDRGGNVVIPSFAVGRTQELLYLIRQIKDSGLVHGHDHFPVWVDSPLANEATNIYASGMTDYYDAETLELLRRGIDPIKFPDLRMSVTSQDSKNLNADTTPKIILSSSGMCEAGRIRHHLKHNLWRRESTILFVGYQAQGTLGRLLTDGAKKVRLFGEDIMVNACIESMEGISGHADQNMLLGWLAALETKPELVFVNHGNDTVCDTFAALAGEKLGIRAEAPYNGAQYDLDTCRCLVQGNSARIVKKTESAGKAAGVFERLLMAGRRLTALIERSKGRPNKELAGFADQINQLCSKWEK